MMETKIFEIRDRATFIPVMATKMKSDDNVERWYLRRMGYGVDCNLIMVVPLQGGMAEYSFYKWGENPTFDPELIHKNSNGTIDTGLMQINSCRNDELKEIGITNLKDPKQNITAGVFIISTLNKYEGEQKYMAYNMGESGMKKAVSRGTNSTAYSRKVLSRIGE